MVVWAFSNIAFLWDWNEKGPFPVLWPLLSFPNFLAYWVQHFHSIIFQDLNNSPGIPSPSLVLFTVMLSKAHLTSNILGFPYYFSVVSDSLWPTELLHARLFCHYLFDLLKLMSIESVMPSNHLILCWPLLLLPSVVPSIRVFSNEQSLPRGGWSIGALASVLPMNIQGWFPLGLTGLISLLSKDSQESSPAPQFKSINSLVFSLLYDPTLTSIHYYRKTRALTMWIFVSNIMSAF